MSKHYIVTIHETVGREYRVTADSEDEARAIGQSIYDDGYDGDVTYSNVQGVDAVAATPLGLTEEAAVPA